MRITLKQIKIGENEIRKKMNHEMKKELDGKGIIIPYINTTRIKLLWYLHLKDVTQDTRGKVGSIMER